MISGWKAAFTALARDTLARPMSMEMFALLAAGIAASLGVMFFAGGALRIERMETGRVLAVYLIAAICVCAAAAAARLYIGPRLPTPLLRTTAVAAAPALAILVIVIPLQVLLQKASYPQGFLTFLFSILAAVLVIVLIQAAFQAARGTRGTADGLQTRRRAIESLDD